MCNVYTAYIYHCTKFVNISYISIVNVNKKISLAVETHQWLWDSHIVPVWHLNVELNSMRNIQFLPHEPRILGLIAAEVQFTSFHAYHDRSCIWISNKVLNVSVQRTDFSPTSRTFSFCWTQISFNTSKFSSILFFSFPLRNITAWVEITVLTDTRDPFSIWQLIIHNNNRGQTIFIFNWFFTISAVILPKTPKPQPALANDWIFFSFETNHPKESIWLSINHGSIMSSEVLGTVRRNAVLVELKKVLITSEVWAHDLPVIKCSVWDD